MSLNINTLELYSHIKQDTFPDISVVLPYIDTLLNQGLNQGDPTAAREIQILLYTLNLSQLACPWDKDSACLTHPGWMVIKDKIETALEHAFLREYDHLLAPFRNEQSTLDALIETIQAHPANQLNVLDIFLKEQATQAQLTAFLFQESPLEMLFGDILAFLLPGVYGTVKMEILKNYWDELGNGKSEFIHRNLRSKLMGKAGLNPNCYKTDIDEILTESLTLINLYLSLATRRNKHMDLVGVFLATELSVVNHFEYQVAGWRRHGFSSEDLEYFDLHISLDDEHSEDWINKVVKPIISLNPENIRPIAIGAIRRLVLRQYTIDALHAHVLKQV